MKLKFVLYGTRVIFFIFCAMGKSLECMAQNIVLSPQINIQKVPDKMFFDEGAAHISP